MGNVIGISEDRTFITVLAADTKPTIAKDGDALLEVDTATWYVYHQGTWYEQ